MIGLRPTVINFFLGRKRSVNGVSHRGLVLHIKQTEMHSLH